MFTRMIVSEELRGRKGGDLSRMELAVFQKTFELGVTDANVLKSARDLKMRAWVVLRDSLKAARRLAGTGLWTLMIKKLFFKFLSYFTEKNKFRY